MNTLKTNQCLHCKEYFTSKRKNKYCSAQCANRYFHSKNSKDDPTKLECQICKKVTSHDLASHISRIHKISCKEYEKLYNMPTRSDTYLKKCSERIKGNKNPAYNHGGKFSPFSKNFIHSDRINMKNLLEKCRQSNKNNGNNSTTIKYWLKRGYTEEQAKQLISERQTTFSKEKCIEKYGEEEGLKRWKDRQQKWQETLNNKTPEEIERINRAKMGKSKGFSLISQKLFREIYSTLTNKEGVYFATLNKGMLVDPDKIDNNFYEYFHMSPNNRKFFFDFFMESNKKIIEFYGDYWHGEKRGNKQRDEQRVEILKNDGFNVYIVYEKDYRLNPEEIIKKCLEYLND